MDWGWAATSGEEMREAVSDVLHARRDGPRGSPRMVSFSLVAHVMLVAAVALMPADWFKPERGRADAGCSISLGGSPGQDTGGMTQMSGAPRSGGRTTRAEAARSLKRPRREAPEMTMPEPAGEAGRPGRRPKSKSRSKSSSRKPTTGAEVKTGTHASTPAARRFRSAGSRPAAADGSAPSSTLATSAAPSTSRR